MGRSDDGKQRKKFLISLMLLIFKNSTQILPLKKMWAEFIPAKVVCRFSALVVAVACFPAFAVGCIFPFLGSG